MRPGRIAPALMLLVACQGGDRSSSDSQQAVDTSLRAHIPGGTYRMGSDPAEREIGYRLSPIAVRNGGWYDAWEADPADVDVDRFAIDRTPVTQSRYAEFVEATGHRQPAIDSATYRRQGFLVHPYSSVLPFLWSDGSPPAGLGEHPVVLVSRDDAAAYCAWRGRVERRRIRLPTESEWEAACRGTESRTFPWGTEWRDGLAQTDAGGTASVRAHPDGASPDGVLDLAGNVFEWTASAMPTGNPVLKSCSWDDAPGTCRCAFRHGRPAETRHILIGFRCAESP